MSRTLLAVALVLLIPGAALAKCAPSAAAGTSENNQWKVTPSLEGRYILESWNDADKKFEKRHEGKIQIPGHHVKTLVADSGKHFVLWDTYEGLAIYAAGGKLVKRLEPKDLLTKEELANTPGKWACHEEGVWTQTAPELSKDRTTLKITMHTKRVVNLALVTGATAAEWVEEGSCNIPGQVKAHGMMNCMADKWTCPRCKKKQNSFMWKICEGCCKELDICLVCNKKIEKAEKPDKK